MAVSPRLKQASKCCTGHFKSIYCARFFLFRLIFSEKATYFYAVKFKQLLVKPAIVTPYSSE